MSTEKRLDEIYEKSEIIHVNKQSRIIFFSDCHRGNNSWSDNFARNQNLFFAAMQYYYLEGYTYIEIGDGDELWENKKFPVIREAHDHVFWLLSKFYERNRLYMIYGNHDIMKKSASFNQKYLYFFHDNRLKANIPLFPGIKPYEGLILDFDNFDTKMLAVHGHQGQIFNDRLWWVNKFLVRNFWRRLELFGFKDPTGPGVNYEGREKNETNIIKWAEKNNIAVITGHSHRPFFPEKGKTLYFNDGSCVHPRSVTGIEIKDGTMALIKWSVKNRLDNSLFIGRDVLVGPQTFETLFEMGHLSTDTEQG